MSEIAYSNFELFPMEGFSAFTKLSSLLIRLQKISSLMIVQEFDKSAKNEFWASTEKEYDPLSVIDFSDINDECKEYICAIEMGADRDRKMAEEGMELVQESLQVCGFE